MEPPTIGRLKAPKTVAESEDYELSDDDRPNEPVDLPASDALFDSVIGRRKSPFLDLEISVLLDPPEAVVDCVLLQVLSNRKDAVTSVSSRLWPRVRLITVQWSAIDPRCWDYFFPIISMMRGLIFKLKEVPKFGTRSVALIGEGTLSEWIMKQFVVSHKYAHRHISIRRVAVRSQLFDLPRAGSVSLNVIGTVMPTLSEPPESIAGLILSTPDLFGSDEDFDPNETTSDDGRSKSGEDTNSSDTGSLAGTAVPVRISFPDREDVAPQMAIRRLFEGASKRDSLLMNTTYIVALDLYFRQTNVILGDPARITDFLQSVLTAASKAAADTTTIPEFSPETSSRFVAASYIIHIADLKANVYAIRDDQDPALVHTEPYRFLSAVLKHCLHHIMKWNSISSRKALVEALKKNKLRISVEGPRRETRVAQLMLYYLLGFNPETDKPIDSISIDADESIPSSYDARVVLREFKALDDSTSVAARLQKVLRRAALQPASGASLHKQGVPLARLFTENEFADGDEYFGDAIDDLSLISGGYTFALRDLTHLKMAFFGAPSVGKSTLINCLLGQSLVYTSIKESTGAPTEIVGTPAHLTPAVVKSVDDPAIIPSQTIAEVTFISEEDFRNIVFPIEREIEHSKSELEFLQQTPAEELGMSDQERDGRIAKLTGHVAHFQQRRTDYLALYDKFKGQKQLFITSKEDLQQYIKIEDKKTEVSLADIVSRVRLFMPGIPLLEHITIVDTPGWNIDSKTFAEDFRLQRSQVEVADVDAWIYLTSAYEFDSLGDNVKMIKSLTKDQAPGLLTITCFDMAKDQKEKGFNYCVSQKLDAVGVFYEGSGQTGSKDFTPITCSKVYADYLEILRMKDDISNWSQKTGPAGSASPASAIVNARNNLRKKWRSFLDYLNSVLDFVLKDDISIVTEEDEAVEDDGGDLADDLLDLDISKPQQNPLANRVEAFVKFVAGAPAAGPDSPSHSSPRRPLKSYNSFVSTKEAGGPSAVRHAPSSKGSSADLQARIAAANQKEKEKEDDVVGDLAVEISGLPHLFSRISSQLQPRIGKILSGRYSKMDQTARVVLSNLFKDILKLQHEIKTSVTRKQIASRLTRSRDAKLAEIALLERNMESFRRIVRKSRSRLETHINLVIQIILQTCDFSLLLDGQRGRRNASRKKKGLDIFFIRREMISLHDYFDAAARGAAHHAIATVMNHIASQHMKLFSSLDLVSPIDYSKLSDADHWLEEAQCVTVGDHEVELRGSDRDGKAVREWLKRVQRSCEREKDRVLDLSMKHFDLWSQRILDEQREAADNFNKKRNKQIKQAEREMRKAATEEIDPDRVKSLQSKLSKKTDHIERLFRTYATDIFQNTVKYYM